MGVRHCAFGKLAAIEMALDNDAFLYVLWAVIFFFLNMQPRTFSFIAFRGKERGSEREKHHCKR